MMFGRPVVATDVGGSSEIVQEGITGFIAEGTTARSLEAALQRAWDARTHWVQMGRAAHSKARELAATNPAAALLRIWTQAGAGTRARPDAEICRP